MPGVLLNAQLIVRDVLVFPYPQLVESKTEHDTISAGSCKLPWNFYPGKPCSLVTDYTKVRMYNVMATIKQQIQ